MFADNVSVHSNESRNTVSPSFQLDLDHLLNEFVEADRDDEASQVLFVITRHISSLRRIYRCASCSENVLFLVRLSKGIFRFYVEKKSNVIV